MAITWSWNVMGNTPDFVLFHGINERNFRIVASRWKIFLFFLKIVF